MIDELRLLKGDDYYIGDKIRVHHPKLSEIVEMGEKEYYSMVTSLCATPSDYKSILLDNFNIDYEEISEFEFFIMMWGSISQMDLGILLPNISGDEFQLVQNSETQKIGLYCEYTDIFIDDVLYDEMVEYIRKMHGLTKHVDKAGNEATKKYLIKKARKELQNKGDKYKSTLAPLVSSMVNCSDFKYDHSNVWEINIYQLMDSVKRIQKLKSVDHIMQGIYSGNVDQKKISKDALDWLGSI